MGHHLEYPLTITCSLCSSRLFSPPSMIMVISLPKAKKSTVPWRNWRPRGNRRRLVRPGWCRSWSFIPFLWGTPWDIVIGYIYYWYLLTIEIANYILQNLGIFVLCVYIYTHLSSMSNTNVSDSGWWLGDSGYVLNFYGIHFCLDVFFCTQEVGDYGCWILLAHKNEGCSHVVEDPFVPLAYCMIWCGALYQELWMAIFGVVQVMQTSNSSMGWWENLKTGNHVIFPENPGIFRLRFSHQSVVISWRPVRRRRTQQSLRDPVVLKPWQIKHLGRTRTQNQAAKFLAGMIPGTISLKNSDLPFGKGLHNYGKDPPCY